MIQRKRYEIVIPMEAQEKIKKRICPVCGKKNKRSYNTCSAKCNKVFWREIAKRNDWNVTKRKCFDRDSWSCQKCGKTDLNIVEADHILPVCLGGPEFDLENIQTLCCDCHKVKTQRDQKLIAEVRAKWKILSKNKSLAGWFR